MERHQGWKHNTGRLAERQQERKKSEQTKRKAASAPEGAGAPARKRSRRAGDDESEEDSSSSSPAAPAAEASSSSETPEAAAARVLKAVSYLDALQLKAADPAPIKSAYRKLMLQIAPDKFAGGAAATAHLHQLRDQFNNALALDAAKVPPALFFWSEGYWLRRYLGNTSAAVSFPRAPVV